MSAKKYKVSTPFVDILIVLVLLITSLFFFHLFWTDLNKTIQRNDKKSVAVVTYKYNVIQRQFNDEFIWDRLKQKSDIYNGDTIKTSPGSLTTITFPDSSHIQINENTLVQVLVNKNGETTIDVSAGRIDLHTTEASSFAIKSGTNIVKVQGTASVSTQVAKSDNGEQNPISIQVTEGNVVLQNSQGQIQTIQQGDTISIAQSGEQEEIRGLTLVDTPSSVNLYTSHNQEKTLDLKWKTFGSNADEVIVEVSKDPRFSQIESKFTTKEKNASIRVSEGNHYWRIRMIDYDLADANSSQNNTLISKIQKGRVSVINTSGPEIQPVPAAGSRTNQNGQELIVYFHENPTKYFSWAPNPYAVAYRFELSNERSFESHVIDTTVDVPSYTAREMTAGTYYWKVTSIFPDSMDIQSQPSATQEFIIIQSPDLTKPVLTSPENGRKIYYGSEEVIFKWQPVENAEKYRIRIYRDSSMRNAILDTTVDTTSYTLTNKQILNWQKYYWNVQAMALESTSPVSTARNFDAWEKHISLNITSPANNSRFFEDNISALSFAWENNSPFETYFQISTSPEFSSYIVSQKVTGRNISGIRLIPGTYYARLITGNSTGVTVKSRSKTFEVKGKLRGPSILFPEDNQKFINTTRQNITVKWNEVSGATNYNATINGQDGTEFAAVRNTTKTSFTQALDTLPDGNYTLSVSSYTQASGNSQKIEGSTSKVNFSVYHPYPIVIEEPSDKITYSGLDALLKPPVAKWNTKSVLENAILIVSNQNNLPANYNEALTAEGFIQKVQTDKTEAVFEKFNPGTYYWAVYGINNFGFDISPNSIRQITVQDIPSLDSIKITKPANNFRFGINEFVSDPYVHFQFQPVKNATVYDVILLDNNGKVISQKKFNSTEPLSSSYSMEEIGEGSFTIKITAYRYSETNELLQKSPEGSVSFEIKIEDEEVKIEDYDEEFYSEE